jgi:hypothetical protein
MEEGRIGGSNERDEGDERGGAEQETTDAAREALRLQVRSIGGEDVALVAVLSFRALQLYRIGVLQKELVEIQHELLRDGKEPKKNIDHTIQKYGKPACGRSVSAEYLPMYSADIRTLADAVRNYKTLTQDIVSKRVKDYKFLGETQGETTDFAVVDRTQEVPEIWERLWRDPASQTVKPAFRLRLIGPLGFRELDKRRRLEGERSAARGLRLRMAVFGGSTLIVPMLIMALRPGLVVDLVTTSVATVLFGAVTAVMATDSSGRDVLASTAAYAAVLVVFVGASLTPGSSASN